jgi:hypothetical protein
MCLAKAQWRLPGVDHQNETIVLRPTSWMVPMLGTVEGSEGADRKGRPANGGRRTCVRSSRPAASG